VLDRDHRVSRVNQGLENVDETLDVGEGEARGRLIDKVDGAAGRPLGELGRKLDPLRLAAGEGSGSAVHGYVINTHGGEESETHADCPS